jgi:cysteine desulfurase / selenocysteine lyase
MTAAATLTANEWRTRMVGLDEPAPLLDGRMAPCINLDNAASTPPLRDVMEAVLRFVPFYSSVHRGAGYKSRISTAAWDEAHETVAGFVGADSSTHTVIFGKNTTEAINKLAFRFPLPPDAIVLTTAMEHHSNDLPWRGRAGIARAGVLPDGRLDEADVDRLLARYGRRVALVAVTGASNVTGFVPPIHRIARKAHAVGARILVDAAQLAPHRRIDVRAADDPEHLDFVAFSAHKMYAPFGTGALVGPRALFLAGEPEYRGGGTVDVVTPTTVRWAGVPDRDEAGSPNVVGAVAMAAAARALDGAAMASIARHETALIAYALERLRSVRGVRVYGASDPRELVDRVGVIPFNVEGVPHGLVAAVLGYEHGIGVRSGCFCAQSYVAHLLGESEAARARRMASDTGTPRERPGMVRLSLAAYNTRADIDAAVDAVALIARGDCARQYRFVPERGAYEPVVPNRLSTRFAERRPD